MDQYSLSIYVILLNHSNMYNLYMCIYVHTHIYTHMYTSNLHNFIVYNYTYITYIVYYIYIYIRLLKITLVPYLMAQFSSVTRSCLTLCDPMHCSMPDLPVHHQLPAFTQIHVHRVGDAIQPFHPLSSPSPPTFNLSQHQGLFQGVSSLHQAAKVLEFQLQHQSFQWIFRTEFL